MQHNDYPSGEVQGHIADDNFYDVYVAVLWGIAYVLNNSVTFKWMIWSNYRCQLFLKNNTS